MLKLGAAFLFISVGAACVLIWQNDWLLREAWRILYDGGEVSAVLVTAILASVIAVWGIQTQRAISRRQTTFNHIAAQEIDADVIRARKSFIALAREEGKIARYAAVEHESSDEARDIRLVLNDFELIAIGIQRGIIDYELYKLWLRSSVINYWNHGEPYIRALRARTRNEMLFHEFESMVGWFKAGIKSKPKRGYRLGQWLR